MEVDPVARQPDDGDHYAFALHPPLLRDDIYCQVYCRGRTWGGSAKSLENRDTAIEYIHQKLSELEEKALDDKYRGSIPRYPEPPKPANTRYVVHPDYEGEIGAREIWGDATLSSFGAGTSSQYADKPWYQTRDAYREWLEPLRDEGGDQVYRVYTKDITEMAYWWYIVPETGGEEELHYVRYRPESQRLKIGTESWTSATRQAGGIGITNPPPADCRHLHISDTPFQAGVEEENIRDWIERESPPVMDKSAANQIDDGEEISPHPLKQASN